MQGRIISAPFSLFIDIDIVQFNKKLCVNKHCVEKEFCGGGFIRLMDASAEKTEGAFVIRVFRAKGAGVGKMFCVSSAAHGVRFPMVLEEDAVDNSHAGSYLIGIRGGISRFGVCNVVYGNAKRFNGFGDFCKKFVAVCGNGVADIDGKIENAVFKGNYAANVGKLSAGFVFNRNAESGAVIIGVDEFKEFNGGFCFAIENFRIKKRVCPPARR